MRIANRIIATLLLLINLYFIPETIWHFNHFGGPYYTVIPLAICLIVNSTLLSASLAFSEKNTRSKLLLAINIIGLCFASLYSIATLKFQCM
jgi:hypothetical protein